MKRCPDCGAGNPERAGWCSLCYRTFPDPEPEPAAGPDPAAGPGPADSAAAAGAGRATDPASDPDSGRGPTPDLSPDPGRDPAVGPASASPAGPAPVGDAIPGIPFRRVDDGFEWSCPSCGAYTSLDERRCRRCATPLATLTAPKPAVETDDSNWTLTFVLSAVTPGAGHLLLGRFGEGLARVLLFLVWALGAVMLAADGAWPPALPLAGGAVALWGISLLEVQRLRTADALLLGPRALLWLVVAVIGLSMLAMAAAVGA